MEFIPQAISGVFAIKLTPKEDDRGFFMRCYDAHLFGEQGLDRPWVQENHSKTAKRHTIRGLHFQHPPHSETKLIRVLEGTILDVFVDLRRNSPTFGKWGSIELSQENQTMIYLPKGIAHGFCSLEDNSHVFYKVDEYYHPESEGGIIFNDPALAINWPIDDPYLSDKDAGQMSFKSFVETFGGLDV